MGIRVLIVLCRFNELIYEKHWTIPDASNMLHTSLLLLLLYCIEHLLCAWGHEASYGWSQELNSPLSDFESAPKPLTCLHSPSLPTPFPSPSQSNSSFMFLGCRSLSCPCPFLLSFIITFPSLSFSLCHEPEDEEMRTVYNTSCIRDPTAVPSTHFYFSSLSLT